MLLLAAFLALAPQDRAEAFHSRVRFAPPAADLDEVQKRVDAFLRRKEHWTAAFKAVESKLSPFPAELAVEASFDLQGESPSHGGVADGKAFVRFNLRRLGDYQVKIDAIEKQRKELAKQGKRVVFHIPPIRFERLIHLELARIRLDGLMLPEWMELGLSAWVADEMNYLAGFAVNGKKVEDVDAGVAEPQDYFGRGHVFWKWMDSKGASGKAVQALLAKVDAQKAVSDAAGMPWEALKAAEKDWSAKQVEKLRPPPK
jgi:hypothetical protein